ncbi:hypothetical protein [Fortiea sp. LEGE XX443]
MLTRVYPVLSWRFYSVSTGLAQFAMLKILSSAIALVVFLKSAP